MAVLETVKDKVELVKAHAPAVLKTGVDTLRAAQEVVKGAGRELQKTLKQGATQIGEQLTRIAEPTRKEQAEAHKEEVKAKKRAKRARAQARAETDEPAAPPAA